MQVRCQCHVVPYVGAAEAAGKGPPALSIVLSRKDEEADLSVCRATRAKYDHGRKFIRDRGTRLPKVLGGDANDFVPQSEGVVIWNY